MARAPNPARAAQIAARNAAVAARLQAKILEELRRGAGKGVEAATRFLSARIKETLSVPAPRAAVRGAPLPGKRVGPILTYRATTRALPGAPPRKLTGRARQSITHKMLTATTGVVGTNVRADVSRKHPKGFQYMKYHELGKQNRWGGGKHMFIKPTVDKYRRELDVLVGAEVRVSLRGI